VVEIIDENNNEIARGRTNYSSEDARRICRKKSAEIADALDHEGPFYEVIVHRNNLQLAQ
ncbi:MAG: glutamate 5-kinase, partial [Thermoguttaceae bacterium]|nr:glutamate 5-kinase [Thermoguttaceae bacterium]